MNVYIPIYILSYKNKIIDRIYIYLEKCIKENIKFQLSTLWGSNIFFLPLNIFIEMYTFFNSILKNLLTVFRENNTALDFPEEL